MRKAGKIPEAKSILMQVRPCDHEGFEGGPADVTTAAENILGQIALDEGNVREACNYLLSSSNVQRCCHNSTLGLPANLAKMLLKQGQYDCVIKYCRIALSKFAHGENEMKSVLQQAISEKRAYAKR